MRDLVAQEALKVMARDAIGTFKTTDPGMTRFFVNSAGYVVFPDVKKGGFIAGGAGGLGVLYEKGKPVGKVKLT